MLKSRDEEDHAFERTLTASRNFDHLGNISNLSPSVQKLLRDFATDSEELTDFGSAPVLQSPTSLSNDHGRVAEGLDEHVNNQTMATTKNKVLSSMQTGHTNENRPEDSDAVEALELVAGPVSTDDTLAIETDFTQVLFGCFYHMFYNVNTCVKHS